MPIVLCVLIFDVLTVVIDILSSFYVLETHLAFSSLFCMVVVDVVVDIITVLIVILDVDVVIIGVVVVISGDNFDAIFCVSVLNGIFISCLTSGQFIDLLPSGRSRLQTWP